MTTQIDNRAAQRTKSGWKLVTVDALGMGDSTFEILSEHGHTEARVYYHKALPRFNRHASESTAGSMWYQCRLIYVWQNRWAVFCPWWDERLIVCLETRKPESDVLQLGDALLWERELILRTLEEAVRRLKAGQDERIDDCSDDTTQLTISTAMHFAGLWQIREAIPSLHELEARLARAGEVYSTFRFKHFDERLCAQIALRRLGETPRCLPVAEASRHGTSDQPVDGKQRHERVHLIRNGASIGDVISQLGHPDYINRHIVRYDVDVKSPYSFVIEFDNERVRRRCLFRPPLWHNQHVFAPETTTLIQHDSDFYNMVEADFVGDIEELN